MPNKSKTQEWLQTTILAMGSVALATTSVAMIYLTSLAHQGKGALARLDTAVEGTLARLDTAVDQLMGNAPHVEGSAVAELAPTLRALADVLREVHDSGLANRASVLMDQLGGSYVRVSDDDIEVLVRNMREISSNYFDPDLTESAKSIFTAPNPVEPGPRLTDEQYTEIVMHNLEWYATLLETSSRQGRGIYAIPSMTTSLIQALNTQNAAQRANSQYTDTYKQAVKDVLQLTDVWIGSMLVTSDGNHPRLHNLVNVVPDVVRNTQTGLRGAILRFFGFLPQAQQ